LGVSPAAPLGNLAELIEECWGVSVFVRPLSAKVSGAYLFDPAIGACILLNANHPRPRRLWSLAHEIGHLLTVREGANVDDSDPAVQNEETFVDWFTAELLLPASAVRDSFAESLDAKGELSVYQLIHMARHFRVSLEAMCRRLERLDLAAPGLHAWLKQSRISMKTAEPQVSDEPESPGRFVARTLEALDHALISEGQAASMLGVDRLQVREWKAEFSRVPLGGERGF
jgi:Zn-dependent peptidase ImmA (M78 family)